MRRTKMVLAIAGLMIAMLVVLAAPTMANDNDRNNNHNNNNHHNRFFDDDLRFVFFDINDNDFDFDFDSDLDQDADSGDVDQSFVVTNTGDNSNQCVGLQGVANTGNAQNQLGVTQLDDGFGNFDRDHRDRFFRDFDFDGFNDDFDFEDSGASIEVSPANTTTCDQQVNQAAAASSW